MRTSSEALISIDFIITIRIMQSADESMSVSISSERENQRMSMSNLGLDSFDRSRHARTVS